MLSASFFSKLYFALLISLRPVFGTKSQSGVAGLPASRYNTVAQAEENLYAEKNYRSIQPFR